MEGGVEERRREKKSKRAGESRVRELERGEESEKVGDGGGEGEGWMVKGRMEEFTHTIGLRSIIIHLNSGYSIKCGNSNRNLIFKIRHTKCSKVFLIPQDISVSGKICLSKQSQHVVISQLQFQTH